MLKSVLGSFAISRALVVLFAVLGYSLLPSVQEGISVPLSHGAEWYLSMWYQWDANWYMSIIVEGYQWVAGDQSNVAFFPLYPMAARGGGWLLGGNYLLGGLLLSSAFMLGGMVFLYRLVRDEYGDDLARRSVWLLAIFPTSVFFTTLYTESLFLMASVAAFYYARRSSWALAGVWGMLAALTRVTGMLLLLPLGWEYLSQKNFSLSRIRPAVLWLALVPVGLFIYMGYLYNSFSEPLAFAKTQATGWGHEFKLPWGSFGHDISFLLDQSELWVIYELAATALLVALIVAGVRKLPGSYTVYMVMSLLLPLTGGTTKSMSRYLLVVFPLFILMAMFTKRRPALIAVSAVSILLLAMSTVAFVTGRWVA
ncbi:MAG: glycosyltransferase family 39 protein [Thermoleophilia bacterium]|nr:glycosyltransferase family 39 protein [Thermoleophilia bacterium]